MTQFDWAVRWSEYSPEKPAFKEWENGRSLTYGELNRLANRLAHYFTNQLNLKSGSRIAILAENCLEYLVLFCASQKTGTILVPLNYRLSAAEINFLLNDASPELAIVADTFREALEKCTALKEIAHQMPLEHLRSFLNPDIQHPDDPFFEANTSLQENDPILILYTSGTTGFPKGALYTHKMLFWNSINTALHLNLTADDRTINCMPLFHTGGWNVLITPLLHRGAYTCIMRQFEAASVMHALETEAVTIFMGVPTMIKMLAEDPSFEEADLHHLRYLIVGGEPMPLPLIEVWARKGIPVRQGFGMTEAGPNLTSLHEQDAIRKKGSIGKPNFYVRTRLVNKNGQEAKAHETGELWIKGPVVTPGYWQNPEATAAAFTDGWLRTGDLLKRDEEGYLYVVDRIKNMFISGGENVYPAEIERILVQHPAICEAAVVSMPHPKWGEVGKACIVLYPGQALTQSEICAYCDGKLARFKIPKELCLMPELPKTASGKIDRKALKGF